MQVPEERVLPAPAVSKLPGFRLPTSQRTTTNDSEQFLIGTRATDGSEALHALSAACTSGGGGPPRAHGVTDVLEDELDLHGSIRVLGFEPSGGSSGGLLRSSSSGGGRGRSHGGPQQLQMYQRLRAGDGASGSGDGGGGAESGAGGVDSGGSEGRDSDSSIGSRMAARARLFFGGAGSSSVSVSGDGDGAHGSGFEGGSGGCAGARRLEEQMDLTLVSPGGAKSVMMTQRRGEEHLQQAHRQQQRKHRSEDSSAAPVGSIVGRTAAAPPAAVAGPPGKAAGQLHDELQEDEEPLSCEDVILQFEAAIANPKTRRDLVRALSPPVAAAEQLRQLEGGRVVEEDLGDEAEWVPPVQGGL